ncbi:uncharacterized protein CANTADRAFT_30350, partial [Suhomyces tanzawaensis NRRL Y-17324]
PQWIPQNIQKRLLLYVLQQLSLFSEIDLPNLEEVSLNNIILRDIAIDPEKVGKIPGCNLRNGLVGYLELNTVGRAGLMGGGVNIDASNVEVVISPDFDVEQDISSSIQFLLMQSTANLANTIIVDTESDEDEESKQPASSPSSGSSAKPSALSGVMAKAVEMALLRLQINITNFKIKMISELTEVVLEIDNVLISTVSEVRNIKVSGVRLITLKPNVNPGDTNSTDGTKSPSSESSFDDDDDDDSNDYGEESLMDSMVFTHDEASSIYMSATSQSFAKDNLFRKSPPPTVLHIDCISLEFEGLSQIRNLKVHVGDVKIASTPLTPTISSIFDGISRSMKIKRHQKKQQPRKEEGTTNPKFPQYSTENDEVSEEEEQEASPTQDSDELLFNKFHVTNIIISSTSALLPTGEFVANNTINFILHNLNIKQKNELTIYGGIETFQITQIKNSVSTKIFGFEQSDISGSAILGDSVFRNSPGPTRPPSAKADIRFEFSKKSENSLESLEITTLMSKNANLTLDISSIMILANHAKAVGSIYSSYSTMKQIISSINQRLGSLDKKVTSTPQPPPPKPQFILQTAFISVVINLNSSSGIKATMSPMSFNLHQDLLKMANILLAHLDNNGQPSTIGEITAIKLITKSQEFKAYLDSSTGAGNGSSWIPRQIAASSSLFLSVSKVAFNMKCKEVSSLLNEINYFIHQYSELSPNQFNSLENSVLIGKNGSGSLNLMQNSNLSPSHRRSRPFGQPNPLAKTNFMNLNKSNIASFRFMLKEFELNLFNVPPNFGNIKVKATDISLFEISLNIHGFVHSFESYRIGTDGLCDNLMVDFRNRSPTDIQYPLILINTKLTEKVNTVDVILHNFLFEYYTKWLSLLESDRPVEEIKVPISASAKKRMSGSTTSKRFDLRFSLIDCVLGLNPGRLATKAYVVIEKGSSELTFGEQFYIKSSLRDLSLLLIDDTKNEEPYVEPNQLKSKLSIPSYTSPLSYYQAMGYISIAKINCTHVGVTFNNHIQEMIERNEKLSINQLPSLLDIKVNSDDHQIELCADSMQAVLQLVNDLKLPLNFKEEDKMKVTVDNEINLLNDVIDQFKRNSDLQQLTLTQNSSKSSNEFSNQSSLAIQEEHFTSNDGIELPKVIKKVDPIKMNIYLAKIKIYLYDGYDWKSTRKSIKAAVKRVEELAHKDEESSDYPGEMSESESDTSDTYGETLFKSIHLALPRGTSPTKLTDTINRNVQNNRESSETVVSSEASTKAQLNVDVRKNYKNLKIRRSMFHKVLIEAKNLETNISVHSTRDPRKNSTDDDLNFELLNTLEVRLDDLIIYDNVPSSSWNKFLGYMNSIGKREIGTSILKLSLTNVRPSPSLVAGEAIMKLSILPLRLHIDQDTLDFVTRFFLFKDARFELPPDEIMYLQKFEIDPVKLKLDYKPKKIDYMGIRSGKASEFMNIFILDGSDLTLEKVALHGIHGFEKLGSALGDAWAPSIQQTQLAGIIAGLSPLRSIVNIGGGVKDLIAIPIKEYKKDKRLLRSLQKGTLSFAKTAGYEIVNLGAKLASGTQVILEQGEEMLGGEGAGVRTVVKKPRSESVKKDDGGASTVRISKGKTDLFTSSQHLHQSFKVDKDQYGSRKLYSYVEMDDEDDEISAIDKELLSKSIFLLDSSPRKAKTSRDRRSSVGMDDDEIDDDDEFENLEKEASGKMISLYSNQPETIKQGIKSAYKSIGKNLSATKRTIINLKNEVNESENFQESVTSVLKTSPIILIRPMIGTTEALSKALMGLSNEIDSKRIIESKDKYRY